MNRAWRWFWLSLLITPHVRAGDKPTPSSPPPLPTLQRPAPSSLVRQPSAWQLLQDPLDRSTGRIVDEPTYQLDRIMRRQDERYGRIVPQTEFQRFQDERERQLRIEQRQRLSDIKDERLRREELDRREYELFLNAGLSTTSLQVMADEQALTQAKSQRDAQLIEIQNARIQSLKDRPNDREQIEADFARQTEQIRGVYESQREQILGDPLPASTQPSN